MIGFATDGKKINPIAPLGFEFTHTSGAGPIVDGSVVALAGGDDVFSTVSLRYGTKLWRIEVRAAQIPNFNHARKSRKKKISSA